MHLPCDKTSHVSADVGDGVVTSEVVVLVSVAAAQFDIKEKGTASVTFSSVGKEQYDSTVLTFYDVTLIRVWRH